MNNKVSLRFQINIRIFLTSLIILIIGGFITIWQARLSVKTELDSSLNLASQLIQLNFADKPSSEKVDINTLLPRIVSLEQTRHLSIQLKQPDGQVVHFSSNTNPETKTVPPEWYVRLISAQALKMEKEFTNADNGQISLIIQANPFDEITEAWKESRIFFITLVMMTAMIFLSVNVLFAQIIQTITIIVEALKTIEQGNYRQKLPVFSNQEYDDIAKAINHLSQELDKSNNENKELTLHTLQIQEEERQHLAKELHDELGQSLTAIKVMAMASKSEKADTGEIADTISSVCDHLLKVVRSMMRNLHPLVLTELGLKAGLEDLLNQWTQRHPELSLTLNCPDAVDKLEKKITIQVFRVIQEGLTNIIRHAKAAEAVITLDITPEKVLLLEVSDNGQGCAFNKAKKGFGLLGIRERIKSLGGELSIQTDHNQGMSLFARIPLK
jgi:two-component system, NarL family, sensor histidine kinase UhpB